MRIRHLVFPLLVLAMVVTAGCTSPSRVTYIPDGGSYTAKDLPAILKNADPGATARVSYDDASKVRQDALVSLRKQGDDAGKLADILTAEFPTDTRSVPFKVEKVTYEAKNAWIVLESSGKTGGLLTSRRLWVISADTRTVVAAEYAR